MMQEYYNNFFRQFSLLNYQQYLKVVQDEAGKNYKFATTPVFVSKAQYERLKIITEAIVRLLQNDFYQDSVYKAPWFLPKFLMQTSDYFGCVDFHIQPGAEKIIEINLFPPGFSSFAELVERDFSEFVGDFGKKISTGFEKKLVAAVTNDFESRQIAIVDIDAFNQYNIDEFRYIRKILERCNIKSSIVPAEQAEISDAGNFLADGIEYDRIYNRLIPFDWELNKNKLRNYSELFMKKPGMFFTNPFGWKLGDKAFLPVLSDLNNQSYNLSKKDVKILTNAVLNTKLLNEFSSLEECIDEFGLPRRVIIKPLDTYAGRGILFKPSNKKLKEIIEREKEKYIIQEIFPAGKIPYIKPDGNITEAKFDVRIVFMNAQVVGGYARSYQGSITNFSGDIGGFTPIFIVV